MVYAALGDSTAVGVGADHGGYVDRVFERLGREHDGARLLNVAVSGATTADVLRDQVDRVREAHPTLVTLGVGANDVTRGTTPEAFARDFEALLGALEDEVEGPIVVTNVPDLSLAPAVTGVPRQALRARVEAENELIREIASRHGVRVVDVFSSSRDELAQRPTTLFAADGYHPSDAGYALWAEAMWPTVKDALDPHEAP